MTGYYLYVTSLLDAKFERRTGIPRVEYELARDVIRRGGKLITYNKSAKAFVEVDPAMIRDLAMAQDTDLGEVLDGEHGPLNLISRFAAFVLPRLPAMLDDNFKARLFAFATPALAHSERRRLANDLNLFWNANASIRYLETLSRRNGFRVRVLRRPRGIDFNTGDKILLPGIIWAPEPLQLFTALRERGVLIAPFIHDLVPIRHPEYFTDAEGIEKFCRFIDTILVCSAAILTNSQFVAGDVAGYMRERGFRALPMHPVALCANLTSDTEPAETSRLQALHLKPGNYVLFVSTFSPRKNQIGAYRLWKRLLEIVGDALPPLVFVGQRGWRSEHVFAEMMADRSMWGRHVQFLEAPTDAELSKLYRDCAFTIFPSLYEGWGLPITESLEFGKPCIAADNTALPEAGQGLALQLPASDVDAWVAAVLGLIREPETLAAFSARIRQSYRHRTWGQFGEDVHAVVRGMSATEANPGPAAPTVLDSAAIARGTTAAPG